MKKACLIIFAVALFLPDFVDAQSFYKRRRERNFLLSGGTGFSSYFGDLNNPGDVIDTKLNLEIGLEYKLTQRFSAKTSITWFQLQGSDSEAGTDSDGRNTRNLSFRSNNVELDVLGVIDFLPNQGQRFYQRRPFGAYGFLGLGILWYNPEGKLPDSDWNGNPVPDAGKFIGLRQFQTEGVDYSSIGIVIPIGLGIRYKINPWFNLVAEGSFRFTFTDYLDDVSSTYAGISSFSDPIAAALSDRRHEIDLPARPAGAIRGNPDNNDGYFLWNIKLEYYLPSLFGAGGGAPRKRGAKYR